jgi:hypothetical protein
MARHRSYVRWALILGMVLVATNLYCQEQLPPNQSSGEAKKGSNSPKPQSKKDAVDETTVRALIKQLGDESFEKREAADKRLVAIGEPALDQLQGKQLKQFEDGPVGIECAVITLNGQRVISGGDPRTSTLREWEVASGKLLFESEPVGGGFLSIAATLDNRRCLTATRDGVVRLWQWKQ